MSQWPMGSVIFLCKTRNIELRNSCLAVALQSPIPIKFPASRLFVSLAILNAEWLHATDRTLLGAAFIGARTSLQSEAGLTDADIDAVSDIMT